MRTGLVSVFAVYKWLKVLFLATQITDIVIDRILVLRKYRDQTAQMQV